MKRSISACLILLMLFPLMIRAQDSIVQAKPDSILPEYKNMIKINSAALLLSNISMLYERRLGEHLTVLAGAGYRWGGTIPKAFGLGDVIVSTETKGITGYSLTPELRYYFNFCQCGESPSGLYAGLYGRFTKYFGSLVFDVWNGEEYYEALVSSNLREFGGGLQLGYQFIFRKRWSVDFMFAGPRLSNYKLKADLESEDLEALAGAIEQEINKRREALGMNPISIDPSSELEASFGFRSFRYAIGIGFMF